MICSQFVLLQSFRHGITLQKFYGGRSLRCRTINSKGILTNTTIETKVCIIQNTSAFRVCVFKRISHIEMRLCVESGIIISRDRANNIINGNRYASIKCNSRRDKFLKMKEIAFSVPWHKQLDVET